MNAEARTPLVWRSPKTVRGKGAREVDWSKTFHVDSAQAFVNGLFGLFSQSIFESFLSEIGDATEMGRTVLYQVREQLDIRFEIKKIGPHEFEVRGSHFHTPFGITICVGKNPT